MTPILSRLAALLLLSMLAACGGTPSPDAPPGSVKGYEAVQDGEYLIPAVDPKYLVAGNTRVEVDYAGDDPPNSIVVDVYSRKLYWVMEGGRAIRYGIAVGRDGVTFRGTGVIGRKAEWPSWTPTANMVRTRPDLYAAYAGGLPGGLGNPLGARALYLYRGGRDTMFRIHGTIDPASIGRAGSAGCIRLFNQDALDLYSRADNGTAVRVRTLEESIALDGPMVDDAYGRVVPDTPGAAAQRARDAEKIAREAEAEARQAAAAEAGAAKEAERAERLRLRRCRTAGLSPEKCPALPLTAELPGDSVNG